MSLGKFLLKNPDFLAPRARDIAMKRQEALQAVRKLLQRPPSYLKPDISGSSMNVYGVGDNVVKTTQSLRSRDFIDDFIGPKRGREPLRRAYLKDLLHAEGLAPETHLVQTRRADYLVQPRMTPDLVTRSQVEAVEGRTRSSGFYPGDVRAGNVRLSERGKPQIIDAGLIEYPNLYQTRPGEAWGKVPVQTEADRRRAREKIVSYGKRAKPWLE